MQSDTLVVTDEFIQNNEEIHASAHVSTKAPAPVEQAYRSHFKETIVPHSGPSTQVIRPQNDVSIESKRANQIEYVEDNLQVDMEELKAAAHAYNMNFQQRLEAVKLRGCELEAKLELEHDAMMTSIVQLRNKAEKQVQSTFVVLEQKILSHFARLESQEIISQEKKLREHESEFRSFAYTTVPNIVENKLQGPITRKLEKSQETFDIENAKIRKREKKTLHTLESNERKTDANFRSENVRRVAKFLEREEEFHHVMRVDNRSVERVQSTHFKKLVALRAQLKAESVLREKEDLIILDNLSSSLGRLQASVLENLGEHDK